MPECVPPGRLQGEVHTTESIMRENGKEAGGEGAVGAQETRLTGIVIASGRKSSGADTRTPRIAAFIWGGKVRPTPTLPYGRWKGAA